MGVGLANEAATPRGVKTEPAAKLRTSAMEKKEPESYDIVFSQKQLVLLSFLTHTHAQTQLFFIISFHLYSFKSRISRLSNSQ